MFSISVFVLIRLSCRRATLLGCGTTIILAWINLLNKLTNSTLPSNSRPKYQRTRLLSSTQWCSKDKDSKTIPFWTSKLTTNLLKPFNSCHSPGVKNGSIKGEAMRLLRNNSSKTTFEESLVKLVQHLRTRSFPKTVIERSLSGVNFAARSSALTQKKKANERILPFVTTYHPAVNKLKQTLMEQWSLKQNQPSLKTIYLKPPIISYKRGKSPKDTLLRSKI